MADRTTWDDEDTKVFIEHGSSFVPERERQIERICRLVPEIEGEFHILDLGCGEGLLAEALLDHFPDAIVHGLDGSEAMIRRARRRLSDYEDRFETEPFELSSDAWRSRGEPVHLVVSSLAVHHLDGDRKRTLFRDVHDLLEPGGAFFLADLIEPASSEARAAAADAWDDAVHRRSIVLTGGKAAFDRFQETRWNHFRHPDPRDTPSAIFDQLVWLAEAGFSKPDVFWMDAGHALFGAFKRGTGG